MTLQFWINLFFWSLPILLGAVIGYVTNAIAIKMLFRPLTKKTVFGITIPFTPGIIPKQRNSLAENIGRMVSERLLTESAIKKQLESRKFQGGFEKSINDSLSNLINKPLSLLKKDNLEFFYNSLDDFFSGAINRFLNSKQFFLSLEELLSFFIDSISKKQLKDVFNSSNLKQFFVTVIIPVLTGEKTKKQAIILINDWLKEHIKNNTQIRKIIPVEFTNLVISSLKYILPGFFKYFFTWLKSPEMHTELEENGILILKNIIDKLNIFQKFFISMGQYDKTLEEEMPGIIDDIIRNLSKSMEHEDKLEGLLNVLTKTLNDFLNSGIADILDILELEVAEFIEPALNKIINIFKREVLNSKLNDVLNEFYANNEDKTLALLIETMFLTQVEDIKNYIIEHLFVFIRNNNIASSISSKIIIFVSEFLNSQNTVSIREFLNINSQKQKKIVVFIKDRLIQILNEKLPDLIESIDVNELVVKKINQLEMIQVEKLLLMVIQKHLKWINLFGGLIGAFIGFSQILIRNIIV